MLTEKQIEIINEPFDPKATVIYKQVIDPKFGIKEFTGRAAPYIIERLNKIFQHGWTNEVKEWKIGNDGKYGIVAVVVIKFKGEDGIWYQHEQAAGCKWIVDKAKADGSGEINVGDTLSGAITSALCKCASLLGIGLDAYKGELKANKDAQDKFSTKIEDAEFEKVMWTEANKHDITNTTELAKYINYALESGIMDPSIYDRLPKNKTNELVVKSFRGIDFQYVLSILQHYDSVIEAIKNPKS